jgi:hypothetical protein
LRKRLSSVGWIDSDKLRRNTYSQTTPGNNSHIGLIRQKKNGRSGSFGESEHGKCMCPKKRNDSKQNFEKL